VFRHFPTLKSRVLAALDPDHQAGCSSLKRDLPTTLSGQAAMTLCTLVLIVVDSVINCTDFIFVLYPLITRSNRALRNRGERPYRKEVRAHHTLISVRS